MWTAMRCAGTTNRNMLEHHHLRLIIPNMPSQWLIEPTKWIKILICVYQYFVSKFECILDKFQFAVIIPNQAANTIFKFSIHFVFHFRNFFLHFRNSPPHNDLLTCTILYASKYASRIEYALFRLLFMAFQAYRNPFHHSFNTCMFHISLSIHITTNAYVLRSIIVDYHTF